MVGRGSKPTREGRRRRAVFLPSRPACARGRSLAATPVPGPGQGRHLQPLATRPQCLAAGMARMKDREKVSPLGRRREMARQAAKKEKKAGNNTDVRPAACQPSSQGTRWQGTAPPGRARARRRAGRGDLRTRTQRGARAAGGRTRTHGRTAEGTWPSGRERGGGARRHAARHPLAATASHRFPPERPVTATLLPCVARARARSRRSRPAVARTRAVVTPLHTSAHARPLSLQFLHRTSMAAVASTGATPSAPSPLRHAQVVQPGSGRRPVVAGSAAAGDETKTTRRRRRQEEGDGSARPLPCDRKETLALPCRGTGGPSAQAMRARGGGETRTRTSAVSVVVVLEI
jgi:hypothetical protein